MKPSLPALMAIALLLTVSSGLSACSYLPSWMGGKKTEKAKLPGERIAVLPVDKELQADEGVNATPFTLPPPVLNADWPQATAQLTAATGNLAASGNFSHSIHASAGGGEAFERSDVPRPVIGGSLVFALDGVGNISAHDAADITHIRWQSKGVAEEDSPGALGGGLAYDQGKLYAISGRGVVVALDAATGKEFWRKNLHIPFHSAPTVSGGRLFAVTLDNQVFALNSISGEVLWNARGINETAGIMSAASPAISGDVVIIPYSSGELYALAVADGKEIWSDSLTPGVHMQASAAFTGISGNPLVDGSVVLAASYGGVISAFSVAEGRRLWERPIGAINTPWIAGDYLFLVTTDNTLICFVKYDGRIRWASKLSAFADEKEKKNPILWKGPVLVEGKLAVAGSNGQMLLVDAGTGNTVSTLAIPEGLHTAPVVAGGRMYLLGQDAVLYELQ